MRTNENRIATGREILGEYSCMDGMADNQEECLIDLLADILHYARSDGEDIDSLLRMALMHVNDEADEEER